MIPIDLQKDLATIHFVAGFDRYGKYFFFVFNKTLLFQYEYTVAFLFLSINKKIFCFKILQ